MKTLGIFGETLERPGETRVLKKPDKYNHLCLTQDSILSLHNIKTTEAMGLVILGRFWKDFGET